MKKPIAVVISDIHYKLDTLDIADTALRMAIDKAAELKVPLIDCGDLTDTKAVIRAEVMNKLLVTRNYASERNVLIFSLVGNHSLVSERSTDAHALGFLPCGLWTVVSKPCSFKNFNFIPYQPDPFEFDKAIREFPEGSIVFAHQGYVGGDMGDYIQDRSAVLPEQFAEWNVFAGHFHNHAKYLNWVSIGNPYSLTFGESNDQEKGFLVVYDDGYFDRVLTNLRRHHVVEMTYEEVRDYPSCCAMEHPLYYVKPQDLLWLKVSGTRSELSKLTKRVVGKLIGKEDFKLDLIPHVVEIDTAVKNKLTVEQSLDRLIIELNETEAEKSYLKQLWRDLLET